MTNDPRRELVLDYIDTLEILGTAFVAKQYEVRKTQAELLNNKSEKDKELKGLTRKIEVERQQTGRETKWKDLKITNKEGREAYLDEIFEEKMAQIDSLEFERFPDLEDKLIEARKTRDQTKLDFDVTKYRLEFELLDMQSSGITKIEEAMIDKNKKKIGMEELKG